MRSRLRWLVQRIAEAADRRRAVGGLPTERLARLDAAVAVLNADFDDTDFDDTDEQPEAVREIAEVFSLDDVETGLLVVAAAADLDANIGTALGLLDWSTQPSRPSMGLALELCGIPSLSAEGRSRLGPTSPLCYTGLVRVEGAGPQPSRTLRCPDVVVSRLLGDETPSALLTALSGVAVPLELEPTATLTRALELGIRLCWVHTPYGAAGAALAAGALRQAGIDFYILDLDQRPAVADVDATVPEVLLEAGLHRRGVVLLGADTLAPREEPARLDLLDAARVPVLAVAQQVWNPAWSTQVPFVVEAPGLSLPERHQVWVDLLSSADRKDATEELAANDAWPELLAMRLTPEEILRTAREARLTSEVHRRPMDVATLRTAARHLSASPNGGKPGQSAATFDDLVLPEETIQPLRRMASWARHRDEVLAKGAVNGPGGKGTGITALFAGGPGTGKTLAAHVIADSLGLELYPIDLSMVVNKYVGETEKNLEKVFAEAETMNVVLFFDEADAIFGSRASVTDARDRYANLEVSFLLQRMEQFDGIVVLATNLRGNLDAAFSRRLHFIVHFTDPDAPTRRRLWEQHVRHAGELSTADPVDFDTLAQGLEISGGDIRNIVLGAALDAAAAGEAVGMTSLLRSAAQEYEKLGRRLPPALT